MSHTSLQQIPVGGNAQRRVVAAASGHDTINLVLKNGTTVSITSTDTDGATEAASTGLGKISDVKGSLAKLFEMIASSDVPSETVDAMLTEVTDSATRRQPLGGGLTKANADFLVHSGALTPEELESLETRVGAGELAHRERETRLGAITRTLTAEQVGERLGISASRVRHRQNDNHLFAFLAGKSRHYPLWQFIGDSDRVVPKLTQVVPAFLEGWHPASIEGFMTTPQEDLASADSAAVTPVEWLASGGDPAAVIAILNRIAQS